MSYVTEGGETDHRMLCSYVYMVKCQDGWRDERLRQQKKAIKL